VDARQQESEEKRPAVEERQPAGRVEATAALDQVREAEGNLLVSTASSAAAGRTSACNLRLMIHS
jgi:hypothetical protein